MRAESQREASRARPASRAGAGSEEPEGESQRHLIVNADDFGASEGINRGIVECHRDGIVTSTSLMVTGRALDDAIELARDYPDLSLGLHWDIIGEDERPLGIEDLDLSGARDEFLRQLDAFVSHVGRPPSHVDSHRHIHMREPLRSLLRELTDPLGVPLRGLGPVRFIGSFYAQPEWRQTDLSYADVPYLLGLLEREVQPGWTEIGCHPGYVTPDFYSVYLAEREHEIATLTDQRVRQAIAARHIRLSSYAEYRPRP